MEQGRERGLVLELEQELGLERDGLQKLDNTGCRIAAQVYTDTASNKGLGTCSKHKLRPCKQGASLFLCP